MDAITGWLLVLLLLSCLAQPVASLCGREDLHRVGFLLTSAILTVLSLVVFREPVIWQGPTLFTLDSFHQVGCHFSVSLIQLPLLWMVWWWMSDRSQNPQRPLERSWLLALVMVFLICDDVWLWTVTLVGCSSLQQTILRSKHGSSGEFTILRGCHWMAILLLIVVAGILSFDFGISTFSELPEALLSWDSFSDIQQADLMLAATLGTLSLILLSTAYPFSVLRIQCEPESDLELVSLMFAAAVFMKLIPMLAVMDVTSNYLTLLLLTIVVSTICSWSLPQRKQSRRATLMAFLMLGLFGMFVPGDQRLNLLGLEQFLLTTILWKLWESEEVGSLFHCWIMTAIGFWMIVGLSGWTWAIRSSGILGENQNLVGLVVGLIAVGISISLSREIILDWGTRHQENNATGRGRTSGLLFVSVVVVIATTRILLVTQGVGWLVVPHWQASVGLLVGTVYILMRRRASSNGVIPRTGSFQRLIESHFHVLTIWRVIACIPTGLVTLFDSLTELSKSRLQRRRIHEPKSVESSPSFVWELVLGGISFLLLAGLFLWMKG